MRLFFGFRCSDFPGSKVAYSGYYAGKTGKRSRSSGSVHLKVVWQVAYTCSWLICSNCTGCSVSNLSTYLAPPSSVRLDTSHRHILNVARVLATGSTRVLLLGDACMPQLRVLLGPQPLLLAMVSASEMTTVTCCYLCFGDITTIAK